MSEQENAAAVSTTAPELPQAKVTIEDIGPARKSLTIEVPPERIGAKLEENYKTLQTDAAVPGFRRGRAPRRLIEKRFGESIRDDARTQIVSESYEQAVKDHKLEVIGQPEFQEADKIKLPDSGPLTYKVEVEVPPTFELPSLEGIEVKKPTIEVKPEDVDREIQNLRQRFGKLQAAKEAVVAGGDWVMADVRIVEGENAGPEAAEINHHPGAYILVPSAERVSKGNVIGIVVEDLDKKMVGKKPGDTVVFSMTGPAAHEDERIKGKPITIHIRVDTVERMEPASEEEVVKHLGLADAAAMKERVQQMLEGRREQTQRSAQHEQVRNYLLEKVPMELPKNLSTRQTARLLHREAIELAMQGVPEPEIEQRLAEMRAGREEAAQRQLKLFFILERAAKQLEVDVTESEVNGAIYMMAMQQGRRPEKLRQEMQRNGRLEQVYLETRDAKTLDKIITKAKVTEVASLEEGAKKE